MPPEGIEIFHRSPIRENSGSMQFVETKEMTSRSPKGIKVVDLSSIHTNVNFTSLKSLLCASMLGASAFC